MSIKKPIQKNTTKNTTKKNRKNSKNTDLWNQFDCEINKKDKII